MTKLSLALLAAVVFAAPAAAQWGLCDILYGYWSAQEQHMILIHNFDDNCAVDMISYEVAIDGQTIEVTEVSHAYDLAVCLCPYMTENHLGGLAPGEYDVVWHYFFVCDGEPGYGYDQYCDTFTVMVPENDPVGQPGLRGQRISGCGIEVSAVPDDGPELPNWGDIKALFK